MKQNKFWGLTVPALLATFLWGTAFPAVKTGYALFAIGSDDTAAQMLFAGLRFAAAGVLTFAVEAVVSRRLALPERKKLPGLLLLALVMTYLQYLFYYIGLANTSGVKGAILNASGTFFTMIIAHFFCVGDRLNGRKSAGCLLGFAGVVLIHLGGEMGGFALRGEGFMLIAAACFAVGSIISKRVSPGLSPLMVTGFQLLIGGAGLILTGSAMGGRLTSWNAAGVAVLVYLACLSAGAYTLWTLLFKRWPASSVSVYSLMIPVFGSLMSALILGEPLFRLQNLLALALVCGGIAVVNLEKKTGR